MYSIQYNIGGLKMTYYYGTTTQEKKTDAVLALKDDLLVVFSKAGSVLKEVDSRLFADSWRYSKAEPVYAFCLSGLPLATSVLITEEASEKVSEIVEKTRKRDPFVF